PCSVLRTPRVERRATASPPTASRSPVSPSALGRSRRTSPATPPRRASSPRDRHRSTTSSSLSLCRRRRLQPFDKARGLRIRELPRQGDSGDLVSLDFVNAPYDDPVDAGSLDKADLQRRFNDRDVARGVLADDLPAVLRRDSTLQLLSADVNAYS